MELQSPFSERTWGIQYTLRIHNEVTIPNSKAMLLCASWQSVPTKRDPPLMTLTTSKPSELGQVRPQDLPDRFDSTWLEALQSARQTNDYLLLWQCASQLESLAPEAKQQALDQASWQVAIAANTRDSIERFSLTAKTTHFIDLANAAIARIAEHETQLAERELWDQAKATDTPESIQYYLDHSVLRSFEKQAIRRLRTLVEKRVEDLWQRANQQDTREAWSAALAAVSDQAQQTEASKKWTTLHSHAATKAEEKLWNEAVTANTVEAYDQYLKLSHSQSKSKEAEARRKEIEAAKKESQRLERANAKTLAAAKRQQAGEERERADDLKRWKQVLKKRKLENLVEYLSSPLPTFHTEEAQALLKQCGIKRMRKGQDYVLELPPIPPFRLRWYPSGDYTARNRKCRLTEGFWLAGDFFTVDQHDRVSRNDITLGDDASCALPYVAMVAFLVTVTSAYGPVFLPKEYAIRPPSRVQALICINDGCRWFLDSAHWLVDRANTTEEWDIADFVMTLKRSDPLRRGGSYHYHRSSVRCRSVAFDSSVDNCLQLSVIPSWMLDEVALLKIEDTRTNPHADDGDSEDGEE